MPMILIIVLPVPVEGVGMLSQIHAADKTFSDTITIMPAYVSTDSADPFVPIMSGTRSVFICAASGTFLPMAVFIRALYPVVCSLIGSCIAILAFMPMTGIIGAPPRCPHMLTLFGQQGRISVARQRRHRFIFGFRSVLSREFLRVQVILAGRFRLICVVRIRSNLGYAVIISVSVFFAGVDVASVHITGPIIACILTALVILRSFAAADRAGISVPRMAAHRPAYGANAFVPAMRAGILTNCADTIRITPIVYARILADRAHAVQI